MLEDFDQKHMYSLYRLLAQYVHGGHASTVLYRKGLGTSKQGGEFISPGDWYLPLWSAWKNLQIFGEYLLEDLMAETPAFLTSEEIRTLDLALSQLGGSTSFVN